MTGGQKTTWADPGKDIPAKGSIRVDISFTMRSSPEVKGVRMKLPENEIIAKFIQFTGNEYQEYLDSKQAK